MTETTPIIATQTRLTSTAQSSSVPDFIQTKPLSLRQVIRKGDRVLFLGDELTQQMFYTRAVATALLSLMPAADLRFFNGGLEGATAGSILERSDDLIALVRPTVVFACFGHNDLRSSKSREEVLSRYEQDLTTLAEHLRQSPGIRRVILVSAPAQEMASGNSMSATSNSTLRELALIELRISRQTQVDFVDTFVPMQTVYAATTFDNRLTYDGTLPTESGHVVLASTILYGIGVSARQLDRVGWSPLQPVKMGRIRGALGLPLGQVEDAKARRSRQLYESLLRHDQQVFRAWRLEKGMGRQDALAKADALWLSVGKTVDWYR